MTRNPDRHFTYRGQRVIKASYRIIGLVALALVLSVQPHTTIAVLLAGISLLLQVLDSAIEAHLHNLRNHYRHD